MKLSPNMIDALDAIHDAGALHRYDGGFWAAPNAPKDKSGTPKPYFGTRTIHALIDRGFLCVTGWRDGHHSQDANNYAVRVERTDQAY